MPTFMQQKPQTRHEIECEICHLQNRLAKNDGMSAVFMYQIEQLQRQL